MKSCPIFDLVKAKAAFRHSVDIVAPCHGNSVRVQIPHAELPLVSASKAFLGAEQEILDIISFSEFSDGQG